MVRGGPNVWAFRDEAFASAPGQTRFLIWVLEFPRLSRFPESFCFLTDFSLEMKTHSCTTWFQNQKKRSPTKTTKARAAWRGQPGRLGRRCVCPAGDAGEMVDIFLYFPCFFSVDSFACFKTVVKIYWEDMTCRCMILIHLCNTSYIILYIYTAISTICRWHS